MDNWYYNSDGTRREITEMEQIEDKIDGAFLGSKLFKDRYTEKQDKEDNKDD